jgi:Xaa-Pro dipeptidase
MSLYREHLATVIERADQALAAGNFDHLLIASGIEKYRFLDDMPYPFKTNPQFKYWLPLTQHPHSWIIHTPGNKPGLVYYQPDDYWHVPPSAPEGDWVEHFDIHIIDNPQEAAKFFPQGKVAIIGEADAAIGEFVPNNPSAVIHHLHFHRAFKTAYELNLMRKAQRKAVSGHIAARAAFRAGESEAGINMAYLKAAGHTDSDVPYNNIVGLNENGATLHYQYKSFEKPEQHRSLLIDAGAEFNGYASDITRTWSNGDARFSDLVNAVDKEQQALAAKVKNGTDYRDLHLECHLRLASVLKALDIVDMDTSSMMEAGVTATFFPHGLGHPIGLQVHDVAGFAADESGTPIPKPNGHPYLRITRTLAPGMVVTIEPGIYFIPSLLAKLKQSKHGTQVNWRNVEHLSPFGGVRIEDEVHCTKAAPENLTRDAFEEIEG